MIDRLECAILPYAWGSRTAIATLQGRAVPSPGPEAELWMGAHPSAPSGIVRAGKARTLADAISADAARELGAATIARFGPRLPFLLKVIAAEQPLSLQAHPTATQAAAGFADEERRGIPRDAPNRSYKDPNHKPELICALTPFEALCGFRDVSESLALIDELALPSLDAVVEPLRREPGPSGLGATFRALMTLERGDREPLVADVVERCRAYHGRFERECAWAVRLAERYPGDAGVVSSLLVNLVRLQLGEGLYLGAGILHAHLHGVGVEIMASSDNVLRGGLTPKYVDVPELLRVLDFSDGLASVIRPRQADASTEVWETPAAEFRMSRLTVSGETLTCEVSSPELVLCVDGRVTLESREGESAELRSGAAAFVQGTTSRYTVAGTGQLFRATTGGR